MHEAKEKNIRVSCNFLKISGSHGWKKVFYEKSLCDIKSLHGKVVLFESLFTLKNFFGSGVFPMGRSCYRKHKYFFSWPDENESLLLKNVSLFFLGEDTHVALLRIPLFYQNQVLIQVMLCYKMQYRT